MTSRRSSKLWRRVARVGRVVVVVALCVLLVSPLRNFLLSPLLPGAWRTHTSFRLVRMLMDNQHFPIDAPYSHGGEGLAGASLTVNLSDVSKFLEKEDPFKEYYAQRKLLVERAKHDAEAAKELLIVDSFKPLMNLKERAQLMFTFDVFMRACTQHGLSFFISEGSLLGSYRHHGLVPWDDDIDVIINGSQWKEVRRVLGNIPGFTLYANPDSQWKFYLSDLPAFHDKPFKWPSLDIFFFSEHDLYVWGLTWGLKSHLMMYTKHLLPLRTVPWERWQVPAPACVERMLATNYDLSKCVTPLYVHKTNEEHYGFQTEVVECSLLHKYYPFVFHHVDPSGRTVESRRIGGRVLQNVSVPPPPQVCLE
ncbi:uncharacterized protein LOC143297231 [Babylonia areolata]|uniref:uncharacterized protein LOC143297231 n=1 Tax=Babylonia areolata TaxID=304850 RepID=UPI003FD29D33